ncbi:MAG: alpha/beta fold hydrolase [Solirubrobacteraceae bacterium]
MTSADGTAIAFDQLGEGPPVILIAGAFCSRLRTAPLAAALQERFTILNCDRRGRGGSGDTRPYSIEREIEDLDALLADAGGSAALFGHSSGATLAMKAAAHGLKLTKLVLYEPPFLVDDSRAPLPADFVGRLAELVTAGRRGDAVELYQAEAIGVPEDVVVELRQAPSRPALEAIAHTLVYDAAIVGDLTLPDGLIASITTPTLVIDGENSPPMLRNAVGAVASALPNGLHCTLAGQTHDINPDATAPVLKDFLAA